MARILAIAYQPEERWIYPLLAAINAQPILAAAHQQWVAPATQLSAHWAENKGTAQVVLVGVDSSSRDESPVTRPSS